MLFVSETTTQIAQISYQKPWLVRLLLEVLLAFFQDDHQQKHKIKNKIFYQSGVGLLHPKDPDMSSERDFPYNPTLEMGMRPSILLQGGVWIRRDMKK